MSWQFVAYSLVPALAMIAAGCFAVYRSPGEAFRSAVLHLAAGVVFAVVAVEFLPDLLEQHAPMATVLGFTGGTAAMLGLRSFTRWVQSRSTAQTVADRTPPYGLLFGTAVDIAIDGLILGIGFAAGSAEGGLLTFALTVELAALGLATSLALGSRQLEPGRTIAILSVLALLFSISAVAGVSFLQGIEGTALATLLAFGSAALLFLVTEELLTEAHETPETPTLTAAFFVGFIVILLFSMQ
jgi:ZIP family zinc transporter